MEDEKRRLESKRYDRYGDSTDRLRQRANVVPTPAETKMQHIFRASELPFDINQWRNYRDFLESPLGEDLRKPGHGCHEFDTDTDEGRAAQE